MNRKDRLEILLSLYDSDDSSDRVSDSKHKKYCCIKPEAIVLTIYDATEQWYVVECYNCKHVFKEGFSISGDAYDYKDNINSEYDRSRST